MPPSQQAEKPESHEAEEPECQEVRTLIKKLRSQKAKKPGSQVIGKSQAPKTKSSTSSIPTPKCDFPALWDCQAILMNLTQQISRDTEGQFCANHLDRVSYKGYTTYIGYAQGAVRTRVSYEACKAYIGSAQKGYEGYRAPVKRL